MFGVIGRRRNQPFTLLVRNVLGSKLHHYLHHHHHCHYSVASQVWVRNDDGDGCVTRAAPVVRCKIHWDALYVTKLEAMVIGGT